MTHQTKRQAVGIHRIEMPTPFAVGTVNSFLILENNERVLVDCGPRYEAAQAVLLGALAEFGLKPEDLTALVLTHGHVDHVGLAGFFQSRGVPIYSHQAVGTWLEPEGEWTNYRRDFFERLYKECGMPEEVLHRASQEYSIYRLWNDWSVVDVSLENGDVFPVIPRFQVVYVPGHAQAAIALWDAENGDFIAGDQLLPRVSSNALIEPAMEARTGAEAKRTKSLLQYRENFRQLRQMDLGTVYPGHGPIFDDAHSLIDKRLADQEKRRQRFLNLLRERGESTAYILATTFFPHHQDQMSLIISETLGYLDWLLEDGAVTTSIDSDGVMHWIPKQD